MCNNQILLERRKDLNLTQKDLSKLTGIDRKTLREYEKCRKEPHDKNAKLLAKTLDVNLSDIQYHTGGYQLTHKDFINRIYELVQDEYTVLSKYNGMSEKVLIRHNCDECDNHEWEVRADSFVINGSRCPICSRIESADIRVGAISKSHKVFLEDLENYNSTLIPLEEYSRSYNEIRFKCSKCGQITKKTPTYILNKNGQCPNCEQIKKDHKKAITINSKINNFISQVKNKYIKLSSYKFSDNNSIKPIKLLGINCDHKFKRSLSWLEKNNYQCPICVQEKEKQKWIKQKTEEYKQEIQELTNGEYKVIGEYTRTIDPVLMIHDINGCGYTWGARPNDFVNAGHRCPSCSGTLRRTIDDIKEEIFNVVGNEFTVVSKKRLENGDIIIVHNECGKTNRVNPSYFITARQTCKYCYGSTEERLVYNLFDENNIDFEYQYYVNNLYNSPYDFKINLDGKYILLELDGIHHSEPIWGEEKFARRKEIDAAKDQYCIDNNIPLVRIPYTEFDNLEDSLVEHLSDYIALSTV